MCVDDKDNQFFTEKGKNEKKFGILYVPIRCLIEVKRDFPGKCDNDCVIKTDPLKRRWKKLFLFLAKKQKLERKKKHGLWI